jgi:hypothetical protein
MWPWLAQWYCMRRKCSVRKSKSICRLSGCVKQTELRIPLSKLSSISQLGLALTFFLVGCVTNQVIDRPTVIFLTPTPRPLPANPTNAPIQNPMPSPSLTEPPISYPPPMNEPPLPQTIAARAARHLAGWLHTPLEEIQVVDVKAIDQMPSLSDNSCSARWESPDDLTPTDPTQGKLLTLQVKNKKYGYYALGEALLLCPIQLQ